MGRTLTDRLQSGKNTQGQDENHAEHANQAVGGNRSKADGAIVAKPHGARKANHIAPDRCRKEIVGEKARESKRHGLTH